MKKSIKVGILTFHYSNNNFGALLQTFAILNAVKALQFDAKIIDFKPSTSNSAKQRIFNFIRVILGYNFTRFRKKYIATEAVGKDLNKLNDKLDTFIVGSDQVWRYRDNHEDLRRYFFDFVNKENKKVAYAASFGLDKWHGDGNITKDIGLLVKRFDYISVREASGVKICKDTFGVDSTLVLDSTLLLDKSSYENIIRSKYQDKSENNNLLSYMLLDDTNKNQAFFKSFAKKHGLRFTKLKGIKILNKYDFWLFNSVAKWLYLIKNSEFVVTDSFHCTVFSIIFNKKFIVLSNPNRGLTRIENLLALINRKDRLFYKLEDIDAKVLRNDFDYIGINKIIETERKRSLSFLKESLQGSKQF
ncbi:MULTISPECIES: polysaccharide pyruvyl transferase family protein [Flavobacteriaceae]|uniref:polysaccharide pyruvyl transferase family protein n=1 Tax=Flavobacteriaceae TaxID=49546 RepID=UPI0023495650|nr:polysaccharide pyruvyl transferase family protein [Muricauda sp. SP22]MDC6362082.1 polysaccharide pyruvyl transferase family protein [Muricauda sp. SP22]